MGRSVLDNIGVAVPCQANWNDMDGDEQVRHCRLCKLNVYNLSAMSELKALDLIKEKEGEICVRFYRREDGTVITQNCPVGLARIRRKLVWVIGSLAASITFLVWAVGGALGLKRSRWVSYPQGFDRNAISEWVYPAKAVPVVMGKICLPTPNLPPPPAPNGSNNSNLKDSAVDDQD